MTRARFRRLVAHSKGNGASAPARPANVLLLRPALDDDATGKRSITAAIYQVATGRELRVHAGPDVDNLLASLLSRDGDERLEARAERLRGRLFENGWTESHLG
jgi:hypothetical protein